MSLLIFSPHPDDELLGCCGLLTRALEQNLSVKVIIVTDGQLSSPAGIRQKESRAALDELGVQDVEFWHELDGALPQSGPIVEHYQATVAAFKPLTIALPSPSDLHPDHRRLTRGLLSALESRWHGELVFYETLVPLPQPNRIDVVDGVRKLKLLDFHQSQLSLYNYKQHVSGLMALRGATISVATAEAFLAYDWDGRAQNFFDAAHLVSIIVRADDHFLLHTALQSLLAQSYDNFEVLVIWYGLDPLPDVSPLLSYRVCQGPGPKSNNLNTGLTLARGEFVAFLDQDDIWYPDHLSVLLSELSGFMAPDIVYGKYQRVFCERTKTSISILRRETCEDIAFEPRKLMWGNFIAFNSLICRTQLAQSLQFDTALEAYEDWDFLLRAELSGARFVHLPDVVCEYRFYPLPGEAMDIASSHLRKGYALWQKKVQEKISAQLSVPEVASLLARSHHLYLGNLYLKKINVQCQNEIEQLTQRVRQLDDHLAGMHTWSDLLPFNNISSDPLSQLAAHALRDGPHVSIILPVCDPAPHHLIEALHSVTQQSSSNWQLCIVNDASRSIAVLDILSNLQAQYKGQSRVKLTHNSTRQGIVFSTNLGASLADHDWLAFLDHDDRLHPDAILQIVKALMTHPSAHALYTDQKTIDSNGITLHVQFKSDWAPVTLWHLNYINHFTCIRKSVFHQLDGLKQTFEGVQDWQLWLDLSVRPNTQVLHLPLVLYEWRATKNSVAYDINSKPYMLPAAKGLLHHHMTRLGARDHDVDLAQNFGGFSHHWSSSCYPLTVVIATTHGSSLLTSLLHALGSTGYPELHIIVIINQQGGSADSPEWTVPDEASFKVTLVVDQLPLNWSRLNNLGAALSHTPWLLFLSDEVELSSSKVLHELTKYLSLNLRVGAVGAKLVGTNDQENTLLNDGVLIDVQGRCAPITDTSLDRQLGTPRNTAAVDMSCLLTTSEAFTLAGGFDERLGAWYGGIDYVRQVRAHGYEIVQASDVVLHHRSSSAQLYPTAAFIPLDEGMHLSPNTRLDHQRLFYEKWQHQSHANFVSRHDYLLSGTRILSFNDT